jgi:hypothetical protein
MQQNFFLIVGAVLSAIAALLHIGIVIKGASWYRFFGAGERFAQAAERGNRFPDVITFGIAAVLAMFAAYALSGAGVIAALPKLKLVLAAITSIYLLRGIAIVPLFVFARQHVTPFLVWSSFICFGFGLVHLIGLMQVWHALTG